MNPAIEVRVFQFDFTDEKFVCHACRESRSYPVVVARVTDEPEHWKSETVVRLCPECAKNVGLAARKKGNGAPCQKLKKKRPKTRRSRRSTSSS